MAHPIADYLATLADAGDRARAKAQAIRDFPNLAGRSWSRTVNGHVWTATLLSAPLYARGLLALEIGLTRDGVAVAWNDDGWLLVRNPPVLVDDPAGDIPRPWTDRQGVQHTRTLAEDPLRAVRGVVLDAIKDALR